MSELVVCGLPYGSQVTDPVTGEKRPITDEEHQLLSPGAEKYPGGG